MGVIKDTEAENISLNPQEPWPGLRTFSENNADFFFGRDEEIDAIYRMIRQETLSILFGKSGLGKSSILQAGVSPKLRADAFIPIYIRLNHHEETLPLEDQVEVFIEESIASNNIDAPAPVREETLWEYFHKKRSDWWDQDNQLLKPVLIFDQFEEILTAGHENNIRATRCTNFLTELEDLIENRPPEKLLTRFKEEKGLAKNYDLERIDYRVLLSLREDYLADFESLRERMRPIMLNRYRLLPMTSTQAISVILQPGVDLVDNAVAEQIIDYVSSAENHSAIGSRNSNTDKRQVEPALLSVILRELNNYRIRTGEEKISSKLVTGKRPEEILYEFYEEGIKGLGSIVRHFIEQQLLTASGARNRVAEEDAVSRFGLTREEISILINRRIIQRDRIAHMTWLELSHDTLTPVVKHNAQMYLIKKRRWRIAVLFSTALLVIAVVGIIAYQYQIYERELQTAEAANVALDIATDLENTSDMSMDNKQHIIDRLNKRFKTLRDFAKNSDLLRLRHALFYAKAANIQLEQGYYERMTNSALLADKLLFNEQNPEGIKGTSPVEKVNIKLTIAKTLFYKGNYSKAHKNLDHANQLISLAQSVNNKVDFKLALADLRSNRIRMQIWNSENKIDNAAALLELMLKKARVLVKPHIDNKTSSSNINNTLQVYEEMIQLYSSKYGFITGYHSFNAKETYTQMVNDFKHAKPFFKTDNWQYFQALSFQFKALMHKDRNEITDARTAHDIAINYLVNLVRNDKNNLFFRYSLGHAILGRAYFSINRDSPQAKVDIETAHSLALTLKRDSSHPYLACTLSLHADHFANQYHSIHGKAGKNQTFFRLMSRINNCRNEFTHSDMLDNFEILGHFYQILSLSKEADNDFSRTEAMRLQNAAFSLLDKQEAKGADKIYLSNRRYYMHQAILNSKLANFIDDSEMETRFLSAMQQINLHLSINPKASEELSSNKLWLLGQYAKQLLKNNRYEEATKIYQELVAFGITQAKLHPHRKNITTRTVWGITQLIRSYSKRSQWKSAIEASELLLQLYDPRKEMGDILFSKDVLKYWKSSHSALAILNGQFKETLAKKNETSADSITNEFSQELHTLQPRLEAMLDLSSQTMKQLQATLKEKNESSASSLIAQTKIFDPKILEISHLIKKKTNVYMTEKPLGWTTSPFYAAPWSYTITGSDIEPYTSLAKTEQKVERVRITTLPFYEKGRLLTIEFSNKDNQYNTQYYLESEPGSIPLNLNGTSPPIHEANKKFPLHLNISAEVAAYLRFFTTFVHGDEGSFLLVESIDEIPWSNNVTTEEKQKVANLLRPLVVWPDDKETGSWYATATVNYSNAIFHAKFKIPASGIVEMLDDFPVASDLLINAFKMAGNTGRSSNFIERLSLNILKDINASDLESELINLISLLKDSVNLSPAHRKSLINEALSLLEALIETDVESMGKSHDMIIMLQKFIKEKSLSNNPIESTLNRIHSLLAEKQVDKVMSLEKDNKINKINKNVLRKEYMALAFYQLFAKDFQRALNFAEKGIEIDNNYLLTYINYAHALLFLDRTDEALAIYRMYKDKPIQGGKWQDIVLDDFEQLESTGITHPSIRMIREELTQ